MKLFATIFLSLVFKLAFSQSEQPNIFKGNQLYKQKQFEKAAEEYKKAIEKNDKSTEAQYNLGNSLYLMKKPDEALKAFDGAFGTGKDKLSKSKAGYNKGVVLTRQKKLEESIDAYKQTLKLNPVDNEARENLQRALNELKQQQEQKKQQQQNDKNKQQNQDQNQDKPQNNNSKLNEKQAERMLNALRQQEKKLQQNIQNKNSKNGGILSKDW